MHGRGRRAALAGLAVVAGLAAPVAATAQEPASDTVWLCHPDVPNPCNEELETTYQRADGTSTVRTPPLAANPRVDCFYVYPTTSDQPTRNANREVDPQLEAVARFQANRFSRRCHVYAPVYRQVTIPTLLTGSASDQVEGLRFAYPDVRAAFLDYWRNENGGRRPFILIGHSQGAGMLIEIMRELVDRRRRMRSRMLSAIVPGVVPSVPAGRRSGGDLKRIPTCHRRRELGCVMAWATFDETPPDDSRYGKPSTRFVQAFGWEDGPGVEAVCTNPTNPRNRVGTARPLVRSEPFPGLLGAAILGIYSLRPPVAATPWIRPPDRYRGRCVRDNGFHVYRVEPVGDSQDLRPSPDETWGLHIVDLNIALGNLDRIVRAQKRKWRQLLKRRG